MAAPSKKVNFREAARRHFEDATLLELNGRFPNSGQLYGYSAECGLKALLLALGHPTNPEGTPKEPYKKHVNDLVDETFHTLKFFVEGRSGTRYLALLPGIGVFGDWTVDHRYYKREALPSSFPQWKAGAYEVGRMLDQLLLDGRR